LSFMIMDVVVKGFCMSKYWIKILPVGKIINSIRMKHLVIFLVTTCCVQASAEVSALQSMSNGCSNVPSLYTETSSFQSSAIDQSNTEINANNPSAQSQTIKNIYQSTPCGLIKYFDLDKRIFSSDYNNYILKKEMYCKERKKDKNKNSS